MEQLRLLLQALRPKQWTKNLIAFAPAIFAEKIHDPAAVSAASLAFVSLCLVSGGTYIINDLLDRDRDRAHPTKCLRPIASGKLNTGLALGFSLLVILAGLALSFLVRPTLSLVILTYIALTLSYSTVIKHYALVDVFAIAGCFVLRAIAGAVAVKVPPSGWFLLVTSLGALFLALEKRRSEKLALGADAGTHRRSLSAYSDALLDRFESVIVGSLLTSYAFYSFLSYHGHWMMLTVPFVLYGVMRYQMLSVNRQLTGAPEDVLWKDRPMQVTIIIWLLVAGLVVYGHLPRLLSDLSSNLDLLRKP